MARHLKNKQVSKGLRRSSLQVSKPRDITASVPQVFVTNVAEALKDSLLKRKPRQGMARIVAHTLATHERSGIINMGKGWNAHLAHRTYLAIRAECGL